MVRWGRTSMVLRREPFLNVGYALFEQTLNSLAIVDVIENRHMGHGDIQVTKQDGQSTLRHAAAPDNENISRELIHLLRH